MDTTAIWPSNRFFLTHHAYPVINAGTGKIILLKHPSCFYPCFNFSSAPVRYTETNGRIFIFHNLTVVQSLIEVYELIRRISPSQQIFSVTTLIARHILIMVLSVFIFYRPMVIVTLTVSMVLLWRQVPFILPQESRCFSHIKW